MYYILKNDKVELFDEDFQRLHRTIDKFRPDLRVFDIEELEDGMAILDGKIVTIEEKEAADAQRELERKGSFKLTKADFWIAFLDLGVTKQMVKEKIALIPDETLRAKTEIRLDDAEFFYRGDEGLIALAKMFEITDEQLDTIFNVK